MTVSRIATRIRSLLDLTTHTSSSPSLSNHEGGNTKLDISEKLIRDVLTYKLDMAKLRHIHRSCDEEITAYQDLFNDIEEQISSSQHEIKQLEEELNQQQLIRKHREECEVLAIQVNTLPSVSKLDGSIQGINENLSEVREAVVIIDGKIDQRSKQYDIIMQAIADMQNKLKDDDDCLDAIDEDDNGDDDARAGDDAEDSRIGREREIEIKKTTTFDDMTQEDTQ